MFQRRAITHFFKLQPLTKHISSPTLAIKKIGAYIMKSCLRPKPVTNENIYIYIYVGRIVCKQAVVYNAVMVKGGLQEGFYLCLWL